MPMVAQFRGRLTKNWERERSRRRVKPLGTAFSTFSGRKRSLEVVPNLGARCVKPWNWFQTSAQAGNAL